MNEVKRYTVVECYNEEEFWAKMKEVKHGDYVLYNDYKELEQQNNELMEFAKEMREIGKLNPDRLPEYTDIIYHHANDLITRITGGER